MSGDAPDAPDGEIAPDEEIALDEEDALDEGAFDEKGALGGENAFDEKVAPVEMGALDGMGATGAGHAHYVHLKIAATHAPAEAMKGEAAEAVLGHVHQH